MHFFLGTQERVRSSRGKRASCVRATEVLLYLWFDDVANSLLLLSISEKKKKNK